MTLEETDRVVSFQSGRCRNPSSAHRKSARCDRSDIRGRNRIHAGRREACNNVDTSHIGSGHRATDANIGRQQCGSFVNRTSTTPSKTPGALQPPNVQRLGRVHFGILHARLKNGGGPECAGSLIRHRRSEEGRRFCDSSSSDYISKYCVECRN